MDAASRLEAALEMWDDGVQLKREQLRRRDPSASDDQIEAAISDWLLGEAPVGPELRVVPWPRPRR